MLWKGLNKLYKKPLSKKENALIFFDLHRSKKAFGLKGNSELFVNFEFDRASSQVMKDSDTPSISKNASKASK